MLRAVLDTNVLVSALLNPRGSPARTLEALLEAGRGKPLVSPEILAEYETVLGRPKFNFDPGEVHLFMERLRQTSLVIHPGDWVSVCSDSSDDKFLACGLAGRADCLITGNKKHFPQSPFLGLRIVSPAEFLAELE